ncbi:MAG: L,D-transpeptidase family protein [Verrucomicrobiae bacterium]|nr:L,D-transpeptidase family protein [Verrucomicrobiae bacterium]
MRYFIIFFISFLSINSWADNFVIPLASQQIILGLADDWNSSYVKLYRFEKNDSSWQMVGTPWQGRLGKSGLAWGRGLHPENLPGLIKREMDNRAPCGVFELGDAYGYARTVPHNPNLRYIPIDERDLWIDDPTSPYYNKHVRLKEKRPLTAWENKQQMRMNDDAHSLKLFIAHNANLNIKPGFGSAIFFHIWRENGNKPTSGCTTMSREKLSELIQWVNPGLKPLFVLLPRPVYENVKTNWALP